MRVRWILALLIAPAALVQSAWADTGHVGLEICNDTAVPQSLSLAFRDDGRWISRGWWQLPPATCERVIDAPLRNRFYYFRSEAQDWQFLDERISFCTAPDEFTIYGDHDCAIRGYDSAFFAKIDTQAPATTTDAPGAKIAYVAQLSEHSRPRHAPPESAASGATAPPDSGFDRDVTFQGCEVRQSDGRVICKLVMEEGQICVTNDGATEPAIIERLLTLDAGAPVRVAGNRLAVGDRVIQASISALTERDETRYDTLLTQLAGRWVSQSDAYDLFVVEGAARRNFYGSVETMTELLSVQTACADAEGAGPFLVAQAEDGGPTHCYRILSLTETDLVLGYMPRDSRLHYRRQDLPLN
ncbi:DUF1036 domain-containing protein [Phaeobacter sp. JH18-32]|uniref:DUF1036 domain-containing protein n=1 Tax=Phaeobacter TaxID=302485 RepID=UPI003A89A047